MVVAVVVTAAFAVEALAAAALAVVVDVVMETTVAQSLAHLPHHQDFMIFSPMARAIFIVCI